MPRPLTKYQSDDWLGRDLKPRKGAEGERKNSQAKGPGYDDAL